MVARNGSLGLGWAPMEMGCSPYDGFYSDGHIMPPLVMDRAGISSGVYKKSASQSESAGCIGELSLEKVGIGLGLKQLEAHFVSYLSPMNTSPGNFSGPFSSTPRSGFEGSFSVSQAQVA